MRPHHHALCVPGSQSVRQPTDLGVHIDGRESHDHPDAGAAGHTALPTEAEVVDLEYRPITTPSDRGPERRRLAAFGVVCSIVAVLLVASLAPHDLVQLTPTPSGMPLPAGVSVVTTGQGLRIRPSPSSASFAVVGAPDAAGIGSISVFSADGRRLRTLAGADAAWLDDATLLTYQPTSPGSASGSVWMILDGEPSRIQGTYGGLVGGKAGMIALLDPDAPESSTPGYTIYPSLAGIDSAHETGLPLAWSRDGSLLAVWQPVDVASTATSTQPIGSLSLRFEPAGVGPDTGRIAIQERGVYFAAGGWVAAYDPTGAPIVVDPSSGELLTTLSSALTIVGWVADTYGLVLQRSDGELMVWTQSDSPGGSVTDMARRQSGSLTYGPLAGEFTSAVASSGGGSAVTIQMHHASVTLRTPAAARVTWLPDGSACLVTVAGGDATQKDTLYRVALP